MGSFPPFLKKAETILLSPLATLMGGGNLFTEGTVVNLSLSFTATGGSFSVSLIKGTIDPETIAEDTIIGLPFGRTGLITSITSGYSNGGLVDILSGPAISFLAFQQTFFGLAGTQNASLFSIASNIIYGYGGSANGTLGNPRASDGIAEWGTIDPLVINFSFRGSALAGLQQVASIALADLIIRISGYHFVAPGNPPNDSVGFTVPITDIVSASQGPDYSLDVASVLNPAVLTLNFGLSQVFVYDSAHAQKQPPVTIQAGAPQSQGAQDFIEIPPGWLVDGNYEEWIPPTGTNFANPTPSVTNGRYWKVFQSPTNSAMLRGITNFTRLVKPITLPGNVSSFVGSPITGKTRKKTSLEFDFDQASTESGIYGFNTSGGVSLFDVISHQFITVPNAIVLTPHGGGNSGEGASNFYSIQMEQWTFPLVNPETIQGGPSANPFGIPKGTRIVTPPTNILNGISSGFFLGYLSNYQKINSPRLKTSVGVVYRNVLPQVGDTLVVNGLQYPNCGRIQTVNLNFSRSGGVVLSLTAEKYQFKIGKWSYGNNTGIGIDKTGTLRG